MTIDDPMTGSHYAVVGIWPMAESQRVEQDRRLHEQVIPLVKAQPGFVAGY